MNGPPSRSVLAGLALLLTAGCQGVPGAVRPREAGAEASHGPAVRLHWSRPFGPEGEVPFALIGAGPEQLVAVTDQAFYRLDLDGRVQVRTAIPGPAAGAGGVSGASWDGAGLGLLLRWRGDPQRPAGGYLAFTDEEGGWLPEAVRVADRQAALRGGWDGQAHLVISTSSEGGGLALQLTRVLRAGAPVSQLLEPGLQPGLALGGLEVGAGGELALCSIEVDGRVLRRRLDTSPSQAIQVSLPGQPGIGPCLLAGSGRSHLLAWKNRAAPGETDGGSADAGLQSLRFDEAVASLVPASGGPASPPVRLTEVEGTVRIEAVVWDGARYLVLLDAAGQRGGRLLLALIDEAGRLIARDLPVPIEVEPALLLPAALVVAGGDYRLLYGLRRPWDEGLLYLARFGF